MYRITNKDIWAEYLRIAFLAGLVIYALGEALLTTWTLVQYLPSFVIIAFGMRYSLRRIRMLRHFLDFQTYHPDEYAVYRYELGLLVNTLRRLPRQPRPVLLDEHTTIWVLNVWKHYSCRIVSTWPTDPDTGVGGVLVRELTVSRTRTMFPEMTSTLKLAGRSGATMVLLPNPAVFKEFRQAIQMAQRPRQM